MASKKPSAVKLEWSSRVELADAASRRDSLLAALRDLGPSDSDDAASKDANADGRRIELKLASSDDYLGRQLAVAAQQSAKKMGIEFAITTPEADWAESIWKEQTI